MDYDVNHENLLEWITGENNRLHTFAEETR